LADGVIGGVTRFCAKAFIEATLVLAHIDAVTATQLPVVFKPPEPEESSNDDDEEEPDDDENEDVARRSST
jgi:hypothetical protein